MYQILDFHSAHITERRSNS